MTQKFGTRLRIYPSSSEGHGDPLEWSLFYCSLVLVHFPLERIHSVHFVISSRCQVDRLRQYQIC